VPRYLSEMAHSNQLHVECFFHKDTNTATYVAHDPETKRTAIIDSVWDFDSASGVLSLAHNDKVVSYVKEHGLVVDWILETHSHADHLSGAQNLKERLGGKIAIGEMITVVQETFSRVFNLKDFKSDGSQFDHLFKDNEEFKLGNVHCKVINTPGHTPSCVTYVIGDAAFAGDAIFMPDSGTGRCDFPKGSSEALYNSSRRLYSLPESTRFFVGHDYAPNGREFKWESSVGDEMKGNKMLKSETTLSEFTSARDTRDATLPAPKLLLPAMQVNIRAGRLPSVEDNGVAFLKIPLKVKL